MPLPDVRSGIFFIILVHDHTGRVWSAGACMEGFVLIVPGREPERAAAAAPMPAAQSFDPTGSRCLWLSRLFREGKKCWSEAR